jgi:GWxTD domain-containing protein
MRYSIFLLFFLSSCLLFRKVPDTNTNNSPTVTNTPSVNNTPSLQTKPLTGDGKVLDNGDSLRVMVALDIPRLPQDKNGINTLVQDFTIQYGILPAYNSPQYSETSVVKLTTSTVKLQNGNFHFAFPAPKREGTGAVMVLEIIDKKSGEKVKLDMFLPYIVLKIRDKVGIFDKTGEFPQFTNYLHIKDTLVFKDLKNTPQTYYVRYYKHIFDPATPPMTMGDKLPTKNLKYDSSFAINSNTPVQFKKAGLYFLLADTTQFYGLGVYMVERKYPKLSYVKDVVEPLRYLTTDDEFGQLRNGVNTKEELDKFWLKLLGGNIPLAQKTIREYYNRVRLANRYFTNYKEGWKTDMGMIFIIYGRPSRIIRTNDMEFWFYNPSTTNATEIRFSFAKKPNQFVDDAYSLVRQGVYENVWYPAIELWRSGKAF